MNLSTSIAILLLISSSHGAKILTLMYHNSTSHHIWMSALTHALAERGHEVTSVDIKMPAETHPNLKTILLEPVPEATIDLVRTRIRTMRSDGLFSRIKRGAAAVINECSVLYKRSPYKDFIKPDFNETFDLVLVDYGCNPCPFGVLHFVNYPPTIVLHPLTHNPHCLLRMANTPLYHTILHFLHRFEKTPLNMWQRLESLASYLYDDYLHSNVIVPAIEEIVQKDIGKSVPSVRELLDRVTIVLVNLLEFEAHVPFPANVIPVGGLHLKPPNPLPKDLKEFLDNADNGAIFVSFGVTYSQGKSVDSQKRDIITRVFSRLPQKIIWKQERKDIEGTEVPPNVKLVSWAPQSDVLGHQNIVLFISHCGGLSIMEAAYHGVPVLGIGTPFMADQIFNAEKLVAVGAGLKMDMSDVTEEFLYQNITEMITNPRYRQSAQRSRSLLRDNPVKPLDRAVYWIEVIAKHREIPEIHLPSVQSLFPLPSQYVIILDIVLVTIAVILSFLIVLLVLWYLVKVFRSMVMSDEARISKDITKKVQ